jgi:hypothetical protein
MVIKLLFLYIVVLISSTIKKLGELLYSTLHWGHTEVFVCKLISGITEGDGLKLHTLIVEHKKRSLSR